jgi:hypothetical protein
MSFRDPLQAAMQRAENLQRELARVSAAEAATEQQLEQLRRALADANAEVARLRREVPGTPEHARRPFIAVLLVGLGLVVATAIAGYHSESFGITMSYAAIAPVGFGLGGWIGSRRSRRRGWIAGATGAVIALASLAVFYNGIWPSL